jgi:hypothetical protein
VSERRGRTRAAPGRRRDQPTTPELESVIGDGDGEKDEGRGATAAEGNLAPRPTRDGLAAVAGPSVEAAEAVAFILAVVDEGKIIQNKRREGGSTLALLPMRFFALWPPLRHPEWLPLSRRLEFEKEVCLEEEAREKARTWGRTSARVRIQRDSENCRFFSCRVKTRFFFLPPCLSPAPTQKKNSQTLPPL